MNLLDAFVNHKIKTSQAVKFGAMEQCGRAVAQIASFVNPRKTGFEPHRGGGPPLGRRSPAFPIYIDMHVTPPKNFLNPKPQKIPAPKKFPKA